MKFLRVVSCLAVVGIAVLLFAMLSRSYIVETRAKRMVGRPISEVVQALGSPKYVVARSEVEAGSASFHPPGFRLNPERAMTEQAYMYWALPMGDWICLFVDSDGILVDVVRASS